MKKLVKEYIESERRIQKMSWGNPLKIGIRAIQIGGLVALLGWTSGMTCVSIDIYNKTRIINSSKNELESGSRIEQYNKKSSLVNYGEVLMKTAVAGAITLGAGVVGTTQCISYKNRKFDDETRIKQTTKRLS